MVVVPPLANSEMREEVFVLSHTHGSPCSVYPGKKGILELLYPHYIP
jgi:hypothetical protein